MKKNSNYFEIKQSRCHDVTITETHLFFFLNRLQFGKPKSFVTMGFPQISSLIQWNKHNSYESWAQSRWLREAKRGGLELNKKARQMR